MTAIPLEHKYRYMTRVNWAGIANLAGCHRSEVIHIVAGRRKSKRLSALLETMELPRKVDWRRVAEVVSRRRPRPYKPSYVREVATGCRSNKWLYDLLEDLEVLGMVEKQRSFGSIANKQEAL